MLMILVFLAALAVRSSTPCAQSINRQERQERQEAIRRFRRFPAMGGNPTIPGAMDSCAGDRAPAYTAGNVARCRPPLCGRRLHTL
jgi:hypothetical protein